MAKTIIIGASSFVGANLARDLVNQGHEVGIFILPKTWHPFLDNLPLDIHYGDILDKESLKNGLKDAECVYQIAGIVSYHRLDSQKIYDVHVIGTKNVLETAKELGIKKIVVTASTAGLGIPKDKNKPLNEESPFESKYKNVMYMYSKHLCIKECEKAAEDGVNVSVVSPTTIYGAGDITMHIGNLIKKIKENKIKTAPPGGNAVVAIKDAIKGLELTMEKGRSGQNYILANEFIPYLEIYNVIANLVGAQEIKKTISPLALPFLKISAEIQEKFYSSFNKKSAVTPHGIDYQFKFRYYDSTKIKRELGWQPQVSFEESIKEAIDFYKECGFI